MLGPVLGGLIVHNLGWRSLFLILGVWGALNAGLTAWGLRKVEWREPATGRFDLVGSCISGIALVVLLVGFTLLPDVIGVGLIVAGLVGLASFLWWETRAAAPLLRVDLLRSNRVFAFSSVATFVNYAATAGMVFLMSLYLQYNRGLNAETAGFVLVASSFFQVALSPFAGRLADRVEGRYVAAGGMALSAVGLLALGFLGKATPYWYVIAVLSLLGVGYAFFSTPNTHAVMGSVDRGDLGIASATLSTMRITGQTISMGVAALVLAVLVGRREIVPSDYPQVLTSVRVSFLVFTVLCVLGVGASLVGPRRRAGTAPAE
jgi:MFS family permease